MLKKKISNSDKLTVILEFIKGKGFYKFKMYDGLYTHLDKTKIDIMDLSNRGLYDLIFSHDFLKAFFGEHQIEITTLPGHSWANYMEDNWKHYSRALVLEEDPLEFLYHYILNYNKNHTLRI